VRCFLRVARSRERVPEVDALMRRVRIWDGFCTQGFVMSFKHRATVWHQVEVHWVWARSWPEL